MNSVAKIEWLDADRNRKWDRQIEQDVQSGKLGQVYERLKRENKREPITPFNDFVDHEK